MLRPYGHFGRLRINSIVRYGWVTPIMLAERLSSILKQDVPTEPRSGLPTLGLAISGGVDSMALAALCSKITRFKYHAFVVDHGARPGSELEAEDVKREVTRFGITTSVLKLEWPSAENPSDLSNFETSARTLRYQALGKACVQHGISSLCVAHHLDDQYETMLMRLAQGHEKSGLLGMRELSDIPECSGLYGVSQSGRWNSINSDLIHDAGLRAPAGEGESSALTAGQKSNPNSNKLACSSYRRAKETQVHDTISSQVSATEALSSDGHIFRRQQLTPKYPNCQYFETGGVKILRPFLKFEKSSLQRTCNRYSIPWFEDHTNWDKTVTRRNAIRHIIRNHRLPRALEKSNIIGIMAKLQDIEAKIEHKAKHIYRSFHIMSLDLGTGTMAVRLPLTLPWWKLDAEAALRALCRLVEHVSPKANITKSNLAVIRGLAWPSDPEPTAKLRNEHNIYTFSGVLMQRKRLAHWHQPGTELELKELEEKNLDPDFYWELSRQPFSLQEKQLVTEIPPMSSVSSKDTDAFSSWHLWDGRYWIRIWHSLPYPLYVRGFRKEDMHDFRKSLNQAHLVRLKAQLKKTCRGDVRYTLPAIVMNDKDNGGQSRVLALPTIGVFAQNLFFEQGPISYQVLYKQINLDDIQADLHSTQHLPQAYPDLSSL